MKTTNEVDNETLKRVVPLSRDEKSRLFNIAQQARTLSEKLRAVAEGIAKVDVATYARLRGQYEMAEFMADWIQEDERNPSAQIIARTGPSLSELILPHIKSYALQVGLISEERQREYEAHLKQKDNGTDE